MPDDKGKVEGFKLTKEQISWSKDYGKLAKVSKMIQNGLRIEYGKLQTLQKLLEQSQGVKAKMLKGAPVNPINEIEGQQEMGR